MKYLKTYENKNGITFKEWLEKNPIDLNTNSIHCNNSGLISLDGIEEFKNLQYLNCEYNNLSELPDLNNFKYLISLHCYNNKLKELPDLSDLKNCIF
jgi:Leucine-rich repeat (LRR) protein